MPLVLTPTEDQMEAMRRRMNISAAPEARPAIEAALTQLIIDQVLIPLGSELTQSQDNEMLSLVASLSSEQRSRLKRELPALVATITRA